MSTVVDDDAGPLEPSATAAADTTRVSTGRGATSDRDGAPHEEDDRATAAREGAGAGEEPDGTARDEAPGSGADRLDESADDRADENDRAHENGWFDHDRTPDEERADDDRPGADQDAAAADDVSAGAAPGDVPVGGPAGDDGPTDGGPTDGGPARIDAAGPGSSGAQVVQDAPAPTQAQLRIDFGAHLEANYRRLVAQLYAITLDPAEAHSAVQDAYSRAWRSWTTVSRSPDATGWVRRVAVRSTVRSWRRLRPRSRLVGPGPNTRTGAMLAALRRLPAPERRCIVLHHMAGASLQEIAAVERVSAGTTAARLARAQQVIGANLADLLSDDFGPDPSSGAIDDWAAPRWDDLQPATSGTVDHEEVRP